MHRLVFALALFMVTVPVARAAHPLITEDTGTQGKGRWQLEANAESTREDSAGIRSRAVQPAATLSYGFVENADLQLTQSWLREKSAGVVAQGARDTAIDFKWRFFEKDSLSLGLKPGVTLPTGDEQKDLGAGRIGWGNLLILAYEPGLLALHLHAGYKRNRNALGERASLAHLSGALVWRVVENVKLVADYARDTNPRAGGGGAERYAVLGAIWSVTPDFDLDLGLKTGHGGATLDRALLLGMTLRW
jgi:hypothetical protein